jgi:hypothetical protein
MPMDAPAGGLFDELHFTESFLGEPLWQSEAMTIAVRHLYVCAGHPEADQMRPRSGRLIFGEVASSTRTVYEYLGDPHQGAFRPGYVLEDTGTPREGADLRVYRFGGVRESPRAWLEWTIVAGSFELELG